jgi:hypothetical protein
MGWDDPDPADVVPLQGQQDWDDVRHRYDPNLLDRPLERCLEVARAGGARTVVVETRYLDLDYRSEYSSFFSKTFAEIPDTAHRLHFFKADVLVEELDQLPAATRRAYLGYMTIRPSPLGRVGRTMLAPPPRLKSSVQTGVSDWVNFFGQRLDISGVPFAQQDTQFGRCAHVAAWICHYTAVLRGDVSRRAMADFSLFADPSVAEGRPLPSQGLTGLQLSNLMREFELPPIVYRMGFLPGSGQEPPLPPHDPEDDPGTWDTRAIAVLCRFLNSGYPVLVGTHEHAFVIVGYRREIRDGQTWIGFIRHDDQRGPYLEVDNILDDVDPGTGHRHSPWQLLLAPVPDKLWLLPEAAERTGRELLLRYDALAGTDTFTTLQETGRLTFRTIAMPSARYKERAASRGLDDEARRELRLARLSRLIWVVEAVDRDARSAGTPSVLGEVVFDSTSSDVAPNVLAIRVPGALLIQQTDGTIRSPLPSTIETVTSAAPFQP